jgi:adenylate cyclase
LLVVARTTAFALRGQGLDVAQIASRLGVSHVLEGSVRKSQGRVRITAQLIDTVSGGHLWAERFDRAIDDIFAVQDEIAAAVVRALSVRLLPDEHHAIRQRETTNAHAHDLYLMARRYFVSGAQGDSRTLESIVRLCQRAIDLDPEYARAWAWMALAQSALKFVHDGAGDGGAAAVQQALKLNPELGDALAVKARLLSEQSREEEALACVERAVATDPESWAVNFNAGNIFYHWRRFDRAKVFWERAVASPDAGDNDAGMLLSTCAAIGDAEGMRRAAGIALERAERALARDDINGAAMCCGVTALAVLGEHARAREMAERGLLIDPDNVKMRYNFACGFVTHLDDHDTALELLGPAFQKMSPSWVKCACSDPDFDPILGDPRFQAMLAEAVARLGLDQQEIAALQVRSSR